MPVDSQSQQGGKWTFYLGTVLEDKEAYGRDVKVHLQELTPFATGEVTPADTTNVVDGGEGGYTGKVNTSNNVVAKYFGALSNRRYPPDLRKNEQVYVVNYADSDTYYWISAGRDDGLRKKERLNWSVSNNPDTVDELTDENTYFVELDTLHGKKIRIGTSNSDGETYRYLIEIDAKANTFKVVDDNDNEILLESETPRIRLRNHDGTVCDLIQKNLCMVIPEDWIVKVGRQAVFDIPAITYKNTEGDGVMVWNAADISMKTSKSMTITSPCIELDGAVHAKRIVSGPIQATGYSTGEDGWAYESSTIDLDTGSGSKPNNSPNEGGGDATNRHAAAWEQVSQALNTIADCLDNLGAGCDTGSIRSLAQLSIMNKNRGE